MAFNYQRTVRFQDTDAAGVVYFANVLAICHEAYEESLAAAGIDRQVFFSNAAEVAMPIVHAQVDFFRPLVCGDRLNIHLIPQSLAVQEFELTYQVFLAGTETLCSQASTRHVCIQPRTRTRQDLPAEIIRWFHQGVDPDAIS